MGDKTKLKINSTEILDDGRTSLSLSNNIIIFLDTNKDKHITKASLGMTPNAYLTEQEDFKFAFLLLIGTMDDSLSFGDRNLVKQELGISDEKIFSKDYSKSYKKNGIMYTYKGSMKDNFILQAELRKQVFKIKRDSNFMKVTRSIFNAFRLLSKIINPILKALSKSKF